MDPENPPRRRRARLFRRRQSATVFLLETPGGAPDLERRSFLAWDPEQEFILRRGMLETRRHGRKPILRRCRTPLAVLQRALATAGAGAVPYTEGFDGGLVGYVGYDFKNCLERLPYRVRDDLATPELRLGFVRRVVAWNHATGRMQLRVNLQCQSARARDDWQRARAALEALRADVMRLLAPAVAAAARARSKSAHVFQYRSWCK